MEKNRNNKKKIIPLLAVILLLVLVSVATYAYFADLSGQSQRTRVTVETATSNAELFTVGPDIEILADTINFAEGAGNLLGSSFAKASLKANNINSDLISDWDPAAEDVQTVESTYNIYFLIRKNTFVYTTTEKKPEILLAVTPPSEDVDKHVSAEDASEIKTSLATRLKTTEHLGDPVAYEVELENGETETRYGYDITEVGKVVDGVGGAVITVTVDEKIKSVDPKSATEHEWGFEIVFVNLDSPQNENYLYGEFSATILLTTKAKENLTWKDKCSNYSLADCLTTFFYNEGTTVDEDGNITEGLYSLYYHDGKGTHANSNLERDDGSYIFSGGANYEVTSKSKYYTTLDKQSATDTSGLIGMKCGTTTQYPAYDKACENRKYYLDYDAETTYEKYEDAYKAAINAGLKIMANYVCFGYPSTFNEKYCGVQANGSTTKSVNTEYIYRILGTYVVKAKAPDGTTVERYYVKLIKNTPLLNDAGSSYLNIAWNTTANYNYWYDEPTGNYNDGEQVVNYATANARLNNEWYASIKSSKTKEDSTIKIIQDWNWQDMITTAEWYTEGLDTVIPNPADLSKNSFEYNAKTMYEKEISNSRSVKDRIVMENVGLMYATDYAYAANTDKWSTLVSNYKSITPANNNWLFVNTYGYQWTITRDFNQNNNVLYIATDGNLAKKAATNTEGTNTLRPVFYLSTDATYESGDGTVESPFILRLPRSTH